MQPPGARLHLLGDHALRLRPDLEVYGARLVTGTGGSYGDHFKMVQSDVKNEYITLEQAEKEYGVVLNPDMLEEKLLGEREN